MAKMSDYAKSGRHYRKLYPALSRDDHVKLGDDHSREYGRLHAAIRRIQKAEELRLGATSGFDMEVLGPLVSGGLHANYSNAAKAQIRSANENKRILEKQAMGHYAAAGIRERAARPRFAQVFGSGKAKTPDYGVPGSGRKGRAPQMTQAAIDQWMGS